REHDVSERYLFARRSGAVHGPFDKVVDEQHDHGADHRHEDAVQIYSRDAGMAELREQPSAHERAHDAEHDVDKHTLAGIVDDLAADPSGYQPENDPG